MNIKFKFIIWVIVSVCIFVSLVGYGLIFGSDQNKPQKESSDNQDTSKIKLEIEAQIEKDVNIALEESKKEINKEKYLLTAYCPCYECSEGYGDMTAIGKRAAEGRTIAVDPDIIPYGTELYIDGVGYRTAEDCGGLVKGKHIDVYFDCHSKVDEFGKRYAEVEI